MLTQSEKDRYDRQIIIPGFGEEGQEKLKKATVLVAGVGGLGCPASMYLAAAGIGTLRLVDNGEIELPNLNRQVLHWTKDIDRPKVESAREKLSQLNPEVKIEALHETIDESNIDRLVQGCDIIVDAMDNLETRFLINAAGIRHGIPLVHGAVYGLEGRAMTVLPGETACLGCLYHGVPPKRKFPVLGTVPGVIACIEASEAIKYLTNIGELLTDKLLIFDGLNMKFMELSIKRDPNCEYCGESIKE
jgi:molybdopterin-synthase adenylyltransferase